MLYALLFFRKGSVVSRVRLIASDLDGTLLRPDGTVSERSRLALRRAQDAGIAVVLVSGRHPSFLRTKAQEAGVEGLALCSNGAIVYDPGADAIVRHMALDPEVARRLISGLREAVPDVAFAIELGPRMSWEPPFAARRGATSVEVQVCGDVLELCAEPVTKLIARHPDIESDALMEHARRIAGEDMATITYSTPHLIEISRAGVHKAAGLAALCEERGIFPEHVVAFGDMPNDLPMLRWAGRGVAVANAHPQVLETADEVTRSNVEDGVAVVVERLLRCA
jgi:Cof subfamily protein (haloacid dehalogenase superfamily)